MGRNAVGVPAVAGRVLAVAILLVTGMGIGVSPASAAPKPIGLSDDGVTFADQLSAPLFDGTVIVPGHTATQSFWVRNRTSTAGNLAIAVRGVTGADPDLAAALVVSAVVGAATSSVIPFPAPQACDPLLSGITLAPSAIVRVEVTLGLDASLHAHATQGSLGSFDVGIAMASTDVAAPDGCTAVDPPDGDGGGAAGNGSGSGQGGATRGLPGVTDSAIVAGAADGSLPGAGGVPDDGGLPDAMGTGGGAGTASGVAGASGVLGTAGLIPWIALAACLTGLVVGGIFAAWRRTRDREHRRA